MLTTIPHGYDQVRATYGSPPSLVEWQRANLVRVKLPYPMQQHAVVATIAGAATLTYGHKLALPNLLAALEEVQRLGLHTKVVGDPRYDGLYAYGGGWVVRAVRGHAQPSLHSWGIAWDFNPHENPLGGTSRMHPEVVAAFGRCGFKWGNEFARKDPMHFQLATGC